MEAYLVEEPGGNFRKTDIPLPTLRPNHVLVRIKASGVNPLDTKIRAGKASHAKQPLDRKVSNAARASVNKHRLIGTDVARSTNASQAVIATNGSAAACRMERFFGLCASKSASTPRAALIRDAELIGDRSL